MGHTSTLYAGGVKYPGHADPRKILAPEPYKSPKRVIRLRRSAQHLTVMASFLSGLRRNQLLLMPSVVAKHDDALKFGVLGAANIA